MRTELAERIVAEWLEEQEIPELVLRDVEDVDLPRLSEILAVVGPRRAGKTYYMYQLIHELLDEDTCKRDDILFVDFEDHRLSGMVAQDIDSLLVAFNSLTGKYPSFLFFDEIQHLQGWSRAVRTLHNQKRYRIIISGSNSELLGREIATELRGRYRDILLLPFSFAEVLNFKDVAYTKQTLRTAARGRLLKMFEGYLRQGGYPDVVKAGDAKEQKRLLQTYHRTIFYRDILERHNIRAKYVLDAMMNYCLDSYSVLFSISSFEKALKASGLPGSKRTISNYLHYLTEAFFVIACEKFSYSPRKRLMNPKKVYLLDVGFGCLATEFSENKGKVLENVVAIELFRRGEDVYYYHGKRECDFILKRGTRAATAIQVCWELNERNTQRELNGLFEAMSELKLKEGMILTYDTEDQISHKKHKIAVVPVWRWLLLRSLEA